MLNTLWLELKYLLGWNNFKYGFRLARSFWLEMLWDASAVNDVRFVVHIKGIIVLMFYVGQKGLFVAEGSFFTFRTIQARFKVSKVVFLQVKPKAFHLK